MRSPFLPSQTGLWTTTGVLLLLAALSLARTPLTGATFTSTTTTSVSVTSGTWAPSTPPASSCMQGQDVQATNKSKQGAIEDGDALVFTYSGLVRPSSIYGLLTDTGSQSITATVTTTGAGGSVISFAGSAPLSLGSVAFEQQYLKPKTSSISFAASLAASVDDKGDTQHTIATVTLMPGNGSDLSAAPSSVPGQMVWSPSAGVQSASGGSVCAPAVMRESGLPDADF